MENAIPSQFRDAAIHHRDAMLMIHATKTIGAENFAKTVMHMLLSSVPVTIESFDKEIHSHMDCATEHGDPEAYFESMIAHAYFSRMIYLSTAEKLV